MIDRRIGKPQEYLICYRVSQFLVVKQIRKKPVGIIAANGTKDHVDLRVTKCLQQILGPCFRVVLEIVQSHPCVRQKLDLQAVFLQSANTDIGFEANKRFANDSA